MNVIFFLPPPVVAICMIGVILLLALTGLLLFRRFVTPRIQISNGFNDGISGIVGAVGTFYSITVGLIAVGVWTTLTSDTEIVSKEAAAIAALYRDVGSLPEPARSELRRELRDYTLLIIRKEWPVQLRGEMPPPETELIGQFETLLMAYQPANEGDRTRYAEALSAYNGMLQQRALRVDAVGGGLSHLMWCVIWAGAMISLSSAYLFHFTDLKLHVMAIGLMATFLGLVLFMIVMNDRPFMGRTAIGPDSYQLVYERVMGGGR